MGEVVRFPFGFDTRKHARIGGKVEPVEFVERARYNGDRATEVPTSSAARSLKSHGCLDYSGVIFNWIPENIRGKPTPEDWERLFKEAWDQVTDETIRDRIRAIVGVSPTAPVDRSFVPLVRRAKRKKDKPVSGLSDAPRC